MSVRATLRSELEALRRDVEAMRSGDPEEKPEPSDEEGKLAEYMNELHHLVQKLLDEAEDAVSEHPAATVAGALALGIVIGRLTVR